MNLEEAKYKFIQEWGVLGSTWGINRAMAQIHAFLMLSPESKTTDEVMEALKISRGNANMNMRALIDWGLVYKEYKPGERKEYFYAEKDLQTAVNFQHFSFSLFHPLNLFPPCTPLPYLAFGNFSPVCQVLIVYRACWAEHLL